MGRRGSPLLPIILGAVLGLGSTLVPWGRWLFQGGSLTGPPAFSLVVVLDPSTVSGFHCSRPLPSSSLYTLDSAKVETTCSAEDLVKKTKANLLTARNCWQFEDLINTHI